MKHYKNVNGVNMEMTAEEVAEMLAAEQRHIAEYWANVDYDEAVNNEIRKKYSMSNELAILRQRDTKPEEYEEYFTYCEDCKALVKEKKGLE